MYHVEMTGGKYKNDVDNSVDNVENVTWKSRFYDGQVINDTYFWLQIKDICVIL